MQNLVITLIGDRNAGKSTTWYSLFGRDVNTGKALRELILFDGLITDVFLINGSPQERGMDIKKIMQGTPRIVLCSIQYAEEAFPTLDHFVENCYRIMALWLNPGHYAPHSVPGFDSLGMMNYLLARGAMVGIRNGKEPTGPLAHEVRTLVHGWAVGAGLAYRKG
jgi:hypothetical protein